MKQLNQFLLEKFKLNSKNSLNELEILVNDLKKTLLSNWKDHEFEEANFMNWNNGNYSIYDINHDNKYFKKFLKEIENYKDLLKFWPENINDVKFNNSYAIALKDDEKNNFISFNLDKNKSFNTTNVLSIDMSKGIRDILLNKKS